MTFSDSTDVKVIGRVGWVNDVRRITTVEFPYLIGWIIFNSVDPVELIQYSDLCYLMGYTKL